MPVVFFKSRVMGAREGKRRPPLLFSPRASLKFLPSPHKTETGACHGSYDRVRLVFLEKRVFGLKHDVM